MTKIISLATRGIYEIDFNKSGENLGVCPDCSEHRKNKKAKCFSWNESKTTGYCSHCEAKFVEYNPHSGKEYTKPVFDETFLDLRPEWIKGILEKRCISEKTLKSMKVSQKSVWMPQIEKNADCIAFPFYRNGEVVNIKYRGIPKSFKLESGAELCWYNYDALLNNKEIIIVEGEYDCLSFIESGLSNVISVPNGASIGKMSYFDSSIQDLDKIEGFYICVDNDLAGLELRDELIRRLGEDRCFICNLRQYKDANEYLLGEGRESLLEVIKSAKNARIDGIFEAKDCESELDELFENGAQRGKLLQVPFMDELISWESGKFAVWTGIPSSGKSELLDFVNILLNMRHGWKVAYFSPENYPRKRHIRKIIEKMVGNKFSKHTMSSSSYSFFLDYIQDNFFWVDPNDYKIETILSKFKALVKTKGIKICVIDPFNCIENQLTYQEQGALLQKMIHFARQNNVLLHLVAHPKKPERSKESGKYKAMTLYDIAGSSDFYNMTDYGIIVSREQDDTLKFLTSGQVNVSKMKDRDMGDTGISNFEYNVLNGRYHGEGEQKNNSTWSSIIGNNNKLEHNKIDYPSLDDKIPLPVNHNNFFASLDLDLPF